MDTFKWKRWRIGYLNGHAWGWKTTVYDISGKWVNVVGPLCVLVEKQHD